MKLLYNWLKEFVDVTLAPRELAERLSLAGVAVDSVEDSPAGPVFDAEIATNRPDLLGHAGVAREVAAILRSALRAAARAVRSVKVQPSPDWLRQRLEALGQTSINNVVDVSNYVMFETGKPVHAFDFDTIDGRRIEVRRARHGEKLRTLDGVERALAPEMCVIADGRRAVALGGIMGGAETEINSLTRNVLIESA